MGNGMWSLFIGSVFVAFLGFFLNSTHQPTAEQITPDALAANMLVYHQTALNYVIAHPAFTGTVPEGSMSFPNWYQKAANWVAVVGVAKVVVTYNSGTVPVSAVYLSKALHSYSDSDIGAGVSTADGKITPALMEPTAGVPTPAGVPVGVVVAYSQIS